MLRDGKPDNGVESDWEADHRCLLDHLKDAAFKDCSLLISFTDTHDGSDHLYQIPSTNHELNQPLYARIVIVDLDFKGCKKVIKHKELMDHLHALSAAT
eukprot:m.119097 g.119097  ORF g.119097 m.119097 type:complete len:99 (-) comp15460_c0_seq2:2233-2529(-)